MDAIDQLMDEHERIRVVLEVLERICENCSSIDKAHMDAILDFLKVFLDRCHHGKEEELLFPALESKGVPREGGPIGAMLAEHERGRLHVRTMAALTEHLTLGGSEMIARLIAEIHGFTSLLDSHIEKENMVLYPMAEDLLSPAEAEALARGFAGIERDRIGPAKHAEYESLIDRLAETYL